MATQIEKLTLRLNKLITVLNTSGLQQSNPALYQVIKELVGAILQSATGTIEIAGGGSGGPLSDKPYLTHQNVLADLPQSRQLLAGDNVNFDDSVFGERTVDVPLEQEFLTAADETATLPNSRELLAGTNITFDDSVPNERTINTEPSLEWSVLTDGDVDNPEIIFAGGDVVMVHVP